MLETTPARVTLYGVAVPHAVTIEWAGTRYWLAQEDHLITAVVPEMALPQTMAWLADAPTVEAPPIHVRTEDAPACADPACLIAAEWRVTHDSGAAWAACSRHLGDLLRLDGVNRIDRYEKD